MKLKFLLSALSFVAVLQTTTAQNVGINTNGDTPDPSAMLDVSATNKGLLIPRINLTSTTDNTTILNPAAGLLIYNTNAAIGNGVGYYSNTTNSVSPSWVKLVTSNGKPWETAGNTGTTAGADFIGTTDAQDVVLKRNGGEIARITSSGIGISSSSPTVSLGAGGYLHFGQAGNISGTSGLDINIDNDNTSTNSNLRIQKDGGITLMQLQENGTLGLGTTNPDASSILDISSTNKGALLPRVALTSTADATTITSPVTSLLVYNTATAGTAPSNVVPGYHYWNGTNWARFITSQRTLLPINMQSNAANSAFAQLGSVAGYTTATSNAATYQVFNGNYCYAERRTNGGTLTNISVSGNMSFLTTGLAASTGTATVGLYKYSLGTTNKNALVANTPTLIGSTITVSTTVVGDATNFSITVSNVTLAKGDYLMILVQNASGAARAMWAGGAFEFTESNP